MGVCKSWALGDLGQKPQVLHPWALESDIPMPIVVPSQTMWLCCHLHPLSNLEGGKAQHNFPLGTPKTI